MISIIIFVLALTIIIYEIIFFLVKIYRIRSGLETGEVNITLDVMAFSLGLAVVVSRLMEIWK